MEGVTGMMARLSHMQRVAAGGSAMYRTRVFFSFRVSAAVATSRLVQPGKKARTPSPDAVITNLPQGLSVARVCKPARALPGTGGFF